MATLGDTLYRGSSLWKRLPGNTTTTRKVLCQTGTGAASAAPTWEDVGFLQRATVTLSDAQIKALPTTGVQAVAAPGGGFRYDLLHAMFDLQNVAGAYGNLSTPADLEVMFGTGGAWASHPIYNDAVVRSPVHTNTNLTDFLTVAHRALVKVLGVGYAEVWNDWNGFNSFTTDMASFENQALTIKMDNNGAGNLTGGNALNTLTVYLYFLKEPV